MVHHYAGEKMPGSERPGDLPKVTQLESGKALLNRRFLRLPCGHASHRECGKQSGELPAVPTIQPSALFPPRTFFLITSSLQPSRRPGSFFPTPQQWSRKRHGYHPLGSSQHACPAARILPDALKEKSRRPGRTPAPSLEDPPRPVSNTHR